MARNVSFQTRLASVARGKYIRSGQWWSVVSRRLSAVVGALLNQNLRQARKYRWNHTPIQTYGWRFTTDNWQL